MPLLKIDKLTEGLPRDWSGFLRDWDRSLRAGNYPETTRYNYLLAAAQLARYLAEHSPDPDADDAAEDPTVVTKKHIEAFQAWMIETRSASTALNKHKGLQQFFRWLLDEDEITRSPMDRVKQPKTPQKLIPVIRDDDTRRVLDACRGKGSPACATRPSSGSTATPEPVCPRSATSSSPTSTSTPSPSTCTARVPRTAASGSARRPPARSRSTSVLAPSGRAPRRCPSYGSPSAA
jgi:hypothetical protein